MTDLQGARIGCAMTGSFCTFSKAFAAFEALRAAGAELYPIMSNNAYALDTRFGGAADMRGRLEAICGRKIWHELSEVEPIGPKKLLDLVLVAPCTNEAYFLCPPPAGRLYRQTQFAGSRYGAHS